MVLYDRRLPFILKLAKNLAKLQQEERTEAFKQYPQDVVNDVTRIIDLKTKLAKEPKPS